MPDIFLNNKYTRWYFSIIDKSIENNNVYVEKHHILPKSLGGTDHESNIAKLTAKQHFICHLLLTRMTSGKERSKMLMAAWAMSTLHGKNHQGNRYKISSRTFESLRKSALTDQYRIQNLKDKNKKEKNPFYGKNHSTKSKEKMSIAKKGKNTGEDNGFYGKTHSEETRQKISNMRKSIKTSDQTKQAMSESTKQYYSNPSNRKKLSDIMKKLCNDPEYRKKRGWKPLEASV